MNKIGFGYDVHRFAEGRRLIIGGVEIEYDLGLEGHSDADVLIHSICDALLGACGLGDIGIHFPDSSEMYRDIKSTILLKKVYEYVSNYNYNISNIDSTVVCEKPKLSPYFSSMKMIISGILNMDRSDINIKATTEEGMGFTGQLEGIKAYSTVLLCRIEKQRLPEEA